jgi:hypothetical protein
MSHGIPTFTNYLVELKHLQRMIRELRQITGSRSKNETLPRLKSVSRFILYQ